MVSFPPSYINQALVFDHIICKFYFFKLRWRNVEKSHKSKKRWIHEVYIVIMQMTYFLSVNKWHKWQYLPCLHNNVTASDILWFKRETGITESIHLKWKLRFHNFVCVCVLRIVLPTHYFGTAACQLNSCATLWLMHIWQSDQKFLEIYIEMQFRTLINGSP